MDLLAKGSKAEAEAFGDVLLPAAVEENSTQGFVEALGIVGRVEEETATRGVIHGTVPV